jgi:hypothetical protein
MDTADSWLIGRLRGLPRRRRLEELLLERRLRTRDLTALVDQLDALELLLLDDGCFRVQRGGRSPFPLDQRPCLFLEAETLPG